MKRFFSGNQKIFQQHREFQLRKIQNLYPHCFPEGDVDNQQLFLKRKGLHAGNFR